MSRYLKAVCLLWLGCSCLSLYGATWYVRPDGGTRYSTNVTHGQCNGKADAPYPGRGVNQPCAFNDVRMLWQDGSYTNGTAFPAWGWVIAGGDAVVIRGSIGTGVSYRIGWKSNASSSPYCDATGYNCWGLTGDPFGSGMPPPPSGTASQHTRILGENYASCTSQSARTQLHGGWGVGSVVSLKGSSYVDLACVDITDFSNCGRDTDEVSCEMNGHVVSDFASDGISLNNTSTDDTLTDVRIHGLASDGIIGASGTGFVANDIAIVGNADSGWNADDGSGATGVGTLQVQDFDISWNGCVEEYPVVDALPYFSCTDQDHGGYGDGFGTATKDSMPPGWQVSFDRGVASYNTQDGLDALHIGGKGSSMTVTHTRAFGNMGQQIKVGGATATITDSYIVGNCRAMSNTIPGTPSGYNAHLDLFCRAGDTAVLINVPDAQPAVFQRNTIYSNNLVALEIEYPGDPTRAAAIQYDDNIFIGFLNARKEYPSPIYSNADLKMFTNPGASFTHNITYHAKSSWRCPATSLHETGGSCSDPHLKDESWHPYGYGDDAPTEATKKSFSQVESKQPETPAQTNHSSLEIKSMGAAALAVGIWAGLRYLRGRDTKA
jgi:hypothetical protein